MEVLAKLEDNVYWAEEPLKDSQVSRKCSPLVLVLSDAHRGGEDVTERLKISF